MKWLNLAIGSLLLVGAAVFIAVKFGSFEVQRLQHEVGQLEQEVSQLEQERERLLEYAQRLSASRRVAQVDVIRQRENSDGHTVSSLWWTEFGPDGLVGSGVAVEPIGTLVYFEALVIKFEHEYVKQADPQRGTSLAMFRRIFGDEQAPESVPELGRAARPPISDPNRSPAMQDELWAKFWEMIDNPALAARYGVRVVQCEAPAVRLQAGQTWEVTLDAAGGLNLKKVSTWAGPSQDFPAVVRDSATGP